MTPIVNCPSCQMPYTSFQLGFPLVASTKYTVVCGFNDVKGRKCGCGACFDFELVEVQDKAVGIKGLLGMKSGESHLEVRAKIRGN
jgi:hypothetical protein